MRKKSSINKKRDAKFAIRFFALLFMATSAPIFANAETNLHEVSQVDPARVEKSLEESLPLFKRTVSVDIKKPKRKESNKKSSSQENLFQLKDVELLGLKTYSSNELKPLYHEYIGKKVSLSDLKNIARSITAKYRGDGYILSQARIPRQKIHNGRVKIRIIEGSLAQVLIKGKLTQGTKKLLEQYGRAIKEEKPLRYDQLWRYTYLANDLPGMTMNVVFAPSKTTKGAADVTFLVDQTRIAGAVEYNNYGSRYLGPQQAELTLQGNGLFGTADQLMLRGIKTPTGDDLEVFQLYYQRPLMSNGLRLNAMGAVINTIPRGVMEESDTHGESQIWNLGVSYPLIRSRLKNLFLDCTFNWTESKMELRKMRFLRFDDRIRYFQFGVTYDFVDQFKGTNSVRGEVTQGLSVFNAGSKKVEGESRPKGEGRIDFTRFNFEMTRLQWLTSRFSGLFLIKGQFSDDPLLSSQEFGFGGRSLGRGFPSSELTGDSGLAGKVELRMNTYPGLAVLNLIQYYIFYDIGILWNIHSGQIHSEAYKHRRTTGSSTGAGVKIVFNHYFSGNLELAAPLTNKSVSREEVGHKGKGFQGFFSIIAHLY